MIFRLLQYTTFLVSILSFVRAQARPGSIPLAIRSPYFNCWLPNPGTDSWPTFWNDRNQVLGWTGYIKIDGVSFEWLGSTGNGSNPTRTEITPTRTILSFTAGSMELEVTFLSPIEPTDLVRQSFPFTYMYLTANATDGANRSVQVYSDISAEWASGDNGTRVTWSTTPEDNFVFHQVQRASPEPMQEINDQAEDATVYYAMANGPNMTWQTGGADTLRGQFRNNLPSGRLNNTEDKAFRTISNDWPVFAFSMDLGNVSEISTPVVWALGLVRNTTIGYSLGDGSLQPRSSFFWTQYNAIEDGIGAFIEDFPNARQRAIELDQKIESDASSISNDYADLVSLSARQTMGGIDITTSKGTDGQWNASDIMIFMKSVGDTSRRVNPTELMFAAFPAYLYLNASWAGFLLRSSLQQASTVSASTYAMPNLGLPYPNAPGNTSVAATEPLAIESSGDMIIMALAHAKVSGDGSLISSYFYFTVHPSEELGRLPHNQLLNQTMFVSSDGQNNPNLAIKGVIAVRAMGEISQIVGQADDASRFKDQASTMLLDWGGQAILSNHIISTYGQSTSWGLAYNLFSDRLLKLDFLNQTIYTDQTNFYMIQIPTARSYGIAYDSNIPDQVKSHWTMLTAATMTDNSTRDDLVSLVHLRAWLNNDTSQFPTDYNVVSGATIGMGGRSSPAQGAMFAFLALNLPEQNVQASVPGGGGKSKRNTGAIIGGVLTGVAMIGLAGLGLLLWKRHKKTKSPTPTPSLDPFPAHPSIPDTGNTYDSYPRRKGHLNSHNQHAEYSAPTPSNSPTPNILSQPLESGLRQHSRAHSTPIAEPFDTYESSTSSTIFVSSTPEFPLHGSPAPRNPKMQSPPPQLNPATSPAPTASAPMSNPIPSQVDATRRLRDEVEMLRSEMAEIRAQRMYDADEAPPQYN
ncbi:hypothetical protein BD779DRAFT_1674373 [Infundibulicybe gibba]|nr:hypothetical protein BD779DRAFT_1674373 [Infundibulicybe gibba]